MADEIFRNIDEFASSETIYSMREQMTPSDAVVASLLAKISACDASPESFDNTVPFISSENAEASAPAVEYKPKRKTSYRPLWKYGSIAAAGIIVLVSTFALMGDGDSSDFKDLVNNVLPDHVITDSDNGGRDNSVPGNQDDGNGDSALSDNHGAASDDGNSDAVGVSDSSKDSQDALDDSQNGENGNSDVSNGDESSTAPAPSDSYTNYAAKNESGNMSFDREILAGESVSNLTISGSNYVVDSAVTQAATSSEIKTISLTIPETSTTHESKVNAQIKELDRVSSDLMVALDVEGFKETLIYMNTAYKPAGLGQFITDAGLDLDIEYSSSVYCKGDKLGYTSYHRFVADDINELVDTYAFANRAASLASYSSYKNADVHVTFKTKSNPTGSVINFGVSDNGYLYVKLTGKSFTFNIGADSAEAFISAVTGE